jgi:dipeptidyl aminopeptidase/acylaminoacyl peptidase
MQRIASFLAGCLLICGISFAAQPTSNPALPIEHFTRYDEFGGIKLSPNGEYAAYLTGRYGRSIIAFISVKEKKMTAGINCPDGFEIYDFDWASNTRVMFSIAERQLGMAQPSPTGELLAVDVDGKRQKFIYGYRAGEKQTGTLMKAREASYATPVLISPLLSDPDNVLIAEHPWRLMGSYWVYDRDAKPRITLLNTYTGKKRDQGRAPLANASVLADHNDQVRFAIGQNEEQKLVVSWKPDPKGEWLAFELAGFRDESVVPRQFAEDNQSIYFTGVREGESLEALYLLNLDSKQVTKLHGFESTDVSSLISDLSGKKIVGVRSNAAKPAVHWLNLEDRAARINAALHKAFPNQAVHIVTATQDGRLAIVFVTSDVNPGEYYYFDTQSMKADFLRPAKPWIDAKTMRPKEPFQMQARDGTVLNGYLTRPTGEGPYAMVVLPHGGPHGVRDTWYFDWEVQLLASRGYAVLQVNFRGSGGYGVDFETAGFREWGGKMQDDITDATQWAIRNGHAAKNKICIYGASYGGYAALMGAVREPTLYQCAIGFAGVYDLELMLSSADIPRSKSGRAYLSKALGEDRQQLRSRSPIHHAQAISVPVLLIHGKEDWRADFEHAKNMKAALETSKKSFEWMVLSREGHGVYDEASRREMYERILGFLDKHLLGTDQQ